MAERGKCWVCRQPVDKSCFCGQEFYTCENCGLNYPNDAYHDMNSVYEKMIQYQGLKGTVLCTRSYDIKNHENEIVEGKEYDVLMKDNFYYTVKNETGEIKPYDRKYFGKFKSINK